MGAKRDDPTLNEVSNHGRIVFPVDEKDGDVTCSDGVIDSELVPGFSVVRLAFWSLCSGKVKSELFPAVDVAT